MPAARCRICKTEKPSFQELKAHWRSEHPSQYVQVQTWLADVDEAIVAAETVVARQEAGLDIDEALPEHK